MDAAADADTELLRCIAEGDARRAGALLVARYADDVYALCRAMVRDSDAAEDLSQDVFGRAFVALAEFRGDSSPRTWLLRIAKNRCIDHLRKQRREPRGLDEEPDAHPADEPLAIDALLARTDVAQALASLNEGERALVVLRFGHGLGYPDLAAAFGLREGTVRMRLSRAVAKMRDAVEPPASKGRTRRAREEALEAQPEDALARSAPGELEEAAALLDSEAVAPFGSPPPGAPREPSRGAPPPPPAAAAPMPPRAAPPASRSSLRTAPLRWIAPAELRDRLDRLASAIE